MIQSVDRAMGILKKVSSYPSWVGVREIARAMDLKVPTVQNLLKTLTAHGMLEFSEDTRGYRVGISVLLLAEQVEPVSRMADFSQPYIEKIFNEFGETTTVCAMLKNKMVVVDSRTSNEPLTVIQARRIVPHPHVLASGKMLLSGKDDAFLHQYAVNDLLADQGSNIPAGADEFLSEVKKVKVRGYAEAINYKDGGVGAVAVPVHGPSGEISLTLACSAPLSRFDEARRTDVRKRLLDIAREMQGKIHL